MRNKKLHALHNNDVCNLLVGLGDENLNDWIVTTAFYSALHFVHDFIFPLRISKNILYKNFDLFYLDEYPNNDVTKHTITKHLVKKYIFKISNKYDWLFKESYNARYRNYIVHNLIAKTAKEHLEEIKSRTNK